MIWSPRKECWTMNHCTTLFINTLLFLFSVQFWSPTANIFCNFFRKVHILDVQPQQVDFGERLRVYRRSVGQVSLPALQHFKHANRRRVAQTEKFPQVAKVSTLSGMRGVWRHSGLRCPSYRTKSRINLTSLRPFGSVRQVVAFLKR